MMTIGRRRLVASLGAAAALAGCRSAPPAQYYRLAPAAGPAEGAAGSVRVRNIGIPAYLQQNGVPQPSGQYQFAVSANELWAEPLAGMLQTVLVQDLAQRLPRVTVTASSGMVGAPADLIIEVNVLRFDPDASGQVTLSAQIACKASADNRFLETRDITSAAMPAGSGTPALMAAMSGLWAGLADQVARMIVRNQDPPAP